MLRINKSMQLSSLVNKYIHVLTMQQRSLNDTKFGTQEQKFAKINSNKILPGGLLHIGHMYLSGGLD